MVSRTEIPDTSVASIHAGAKDEHETGKREHATGVDEGLGLYGGEQRLRLPAGQVLIYRGHTAPGVFVFLSGCVHSGARVWRSNDADQSLLVVPEVSALDSPLPESVTVEDDATALFVPRSVVLREPSVQQLLQIIASGRFSPKTLPASGGETGDVDSHGIERGDVRTG
jgi:hypothetical protein